MTTMGESDLTGEPLMTEHSKITDSLRRQYDEHSSEYMERRGLQQGMLENIWALLKHRVSNPSFSDVVDFGCGAGNLLELMDPNKQTYTGVDISAEQLEKAQDLARRLSFAATLINSDITCVPLQDERFDLVLSNSVLHWLNRVGRSAVVKAVREAYRLLRSRGIFAGSISGRGTGRRFLEAYHLTMERAAATGKLTGSGFCLDPLSSMALSDVVDILDGQNFCIQTALKRYEPTTFSSAAEYCEVVEAYGFEIFMRDVKPELKCDVWIDLERAFSEIAGQGEYKHDQYVVYFIAQKPEESGG